MLASFVSRRPGARALPLALACAALLAPLPAVAADEVRSPRRESFALDSAAVASGKMGDGGSVTFHVLVPPSYEANPSRRYPVVYFLPGWNDRPEQVAFWVAPLGAWFAQHPEAEFLLVAVDGRNRLGGGFYVNSPATGRWEDFVVQEMVGEIDRRYRTIPAAASRGLLGSSMGGFGALHVGLRHPGVFSSVFAMGPGVLAPGALPQAMPTWASTPAFLTAYGAAFAPDLASGPPFARVPRLDGSAADAAVVALWEQGFGGWEARLASYAAGPARLRAVHLEVGTRDAYGWIVAGTVYLYGLMQEQGLAVELATHRGGHGLPVAEVTASIAPFFRAQLRTER